MTLANVKLSICDILTVMNQISATSRFAPATWSKSRVRHVRLLALSLATVAIVAALPAISHLLTSVPASEPIQQHRWVYLMLLITVIQLGLAVFLILYVDWSALWAVTIANLLFVGVYAGLFAVRILAESGNEIISYLQLDLEEAPSGKQAMWFMLVILMFVTQSFFTGRYARRWKRER
jgi:cytochrome bd-type quinol oxidase subunit 2